MGVATWRSAGLERAQAFTWERSAIELRRAYQDAVAGEGNADVRIAIDAASCRTADRRRAATWRRFSRPGASCRRAAAHEFVLCSPERVTHSALGSLRVSCQVSPGSGTLWEQRRPAGLVASAGADVLFSPAYTCPLWCRAPIVLAIHDVSFAAHPEWFSWREGLRRRTLTRLGARRAARVITESDFSKREIIAISASSSSDIDVIYLGASTLAARQRTRRGSRSCSTSARSSIAATSRS